MGWQYVMIGHIANTVEQNYNSFTIKYKAMFFNEEGILNIDEMVVNNASFKTIMEDGVITEEEIKAQSDKVVAMLHDMEAKYSEEQLVEIKNVFAEISVLYTIFNYNSLHNL